MSDGANNLDALLGSRICHDLISPLGAIGNGLELLQLSGIEETPELALIAESVRNANARIRFFRVAFGDAAPGQQIGAAEIRDILSGMAAGRNTVVDWRIDGTVPRAEAKLVFLLLQCCESALAWGGRIIVNRSGSNWRLDASAKRLREIPELWAVLTRDRPDAAQVPTGAEPAGDTVAASAQGVTTAPPPRNGPSPGDDSGPGQRKDAGNRRDTAGGTNIAASDVHFALARRAAERSGRILRVGCHPQSIAISA